MDNHVVVDALELHRPGFRLGPVSFTAAAAGRLAIVGPSGSGKTTLLRCIAGLETPAAGTVRIGADEVHGPRGAVPPDRRGLGFVFQDGALWPHLTALQHLRFAAPRLSPAAAQDLLQRGGLGHLSARKPAAMSGGEAQRLGLLRALAAEPRVLLLDEPLRSVDVHQRDALVLMIATFANERRLTTILVTHDRDEALALATELVVMHEGTVVERGAAAELLVAPRTAFTAAFLGGAACLPAAATGDGAVDTVFGRFEAPRADGELRLVLLPGDVAAAATAERRDAPCGRVLAAVPGPRDCALRIALGDQIVPALAPHALPVGSTAFLTMLRPPRLLPWRAGGTP